MDGIGNTSERLRGGHSVLFLERLPFVRSAAPFGINFVVNQATISDLDEAVALAVDFGAIEFWRYRNNLRAIPRY